MGIALLTLSSLFQGFARRRPATRPAPERQQAALAARMVVPSNRPLVRARPMTSICAQRPATLRVVRVREENSPACEVGRMVISGRMADVCAELDRLVASEAATQQSRLRH